MSSSSDLTWLLVKKWNSFQVNAGPESPKFSREPGNLRNIHSNKYSGLTNDKRITLKESNGAIHLSTRKPKASPHSVKSGEHVTTLRKGGSRRHAGHISGLARGGYRADLRTSALARLSALNAAKNGPKEGSQRKTRSEKKAEAAAAASSA